MRATDTTQARRGVWQAVEGPPDGEVPENVSRHTATLVLGSWVGALFTFPYSFPRPVWCFPTILVRMPVRWLPEDRPWDRLSLLPRPQPGWRTAFTTRTHAHAHKRCQNCITRTRGQRACFVCPVSSAATAVGASTLSCIWHAPARSLMESGVTEMQDLAGLSSDRLKELGLSMGQRNRLVKSPQDLVTSPDIMHQILIRNNFVMNIISHPNSYLS